MHSMAFHAPQDANSGTFQALDLYPGPAVAVGHQLGAQFVAPTT
jgi:hypothetical protein